MSTDDPIPSGPWHGFYNYDAGGERHRMDLRLDFREGRIRGDGIDDIGRFAIRGTYDAATLRCSWFKTYIGAHTVHYDGVFDLGSIWGLWTLDFGRGGFRIWPGARGEGVSREASEDVPLVETEDVVAPRRLEP